MPVLTVMSAKSLAHLHAAVVVEELHRCGVEVFCLWPGARAIPLVLALDDHPAVATRLFNDERSAAFWAQGAEKAGVLTCLICTSGTAAANYVPAVVEAALAGVPLLVLTTDRPFELHYAKANQTLPQRDMFSPFTQTTFDIPAPEQRLFLHALLADLDQAVFEMRRTARPVQVNLAYRKPFVETSSTGVTLPPEDREIFARWSATTTPYCTYLPPQMRLATSAAGWGTAPTGRPGVVLRRPHRLRTTAGVSRRPASGVYLVFLLPLAAGCHRERIYLPDDESVGRPMCRCR